MLTCDAERDLEAVLAAAVARDARVEAAVVALRDVDDERVKAVFVHHDLVVRVIVHLQ